MSQIAKFEKRIQEFNKMYKMPKVRGLADMAMRLSNFQSILKEECMELDSVFPVTGSETIDLSLTGKVVLDLKTNLADLLGDIIVYCASEAVRWDIPIGDVLTIIMDSNFSKLGADNKPIYDERGKLLKGPNYWKPEPKIEALLSGQTGVV